LKINVNTLKKSAIRAADWLSASSQINDKNSNFFGALKNDYDIKEQKWYFYEPFWHTAHGLRALLALSKELNTDKWDDAIDNAAYFLKKQIINNPERPRIHGGLMRVHGPVETCVPFGKMGCTTLTDGLEGLFDYYLIKKDPDTLEAIKRAEHWLTNVMYDKKTGFLWSFMDMETEEYYKDIIRRLNRDNKAYFYKRPDAEGSSLLLLGKLFNKPKLIDGFKKILDFLVHDQGKDGIWWNWACNKKDPPRAHGRYNLWLAFALLNGYEFFGDDIYREAALRTAKFYRQAQYPNGSMSYMTIQGEKGEMINPCGSAVALAALLWLKLMSYEFDEDFACGVKLSCEFLLNTQYSDSFFDHNLRGAYFELHNNNVRDIASVFGIQLATKLTAGLKKMGIVNLEEWMASKTKWKWEKWPAESII